MFTIKYEQTTGGMHSSRPHETALANALDDSSIEESVVKAYYDDGHGEGARNFRAALKQLRAIKDRLYISVEPAYFSEYGLPFSEEKKIFVDGERINWEEINNRNKCSCCGNSLSGGK